VRTSFLFVLTLLAGTLAGAAWERSTAQSAAPANPTPPQAQSPPPSVPAPVTGAQAIVSAPQLQPPVRAPLGVVVLDPAHGGTDPGARGVGGVRESDLVLDFAAQIRTELEKDGLRVLLTRQGNEDPTFDDRSALVNAQRGAIFISLHVGSTGLPGTVRVYTLPDAPFLSSSAGAGPGAASGLIPWDRAQAPYLTLSRKLADIAQGQLALQFKGSPNSAQTAAVRQLRSVAAPAIAIEISSVTTEDRSILDRMAPGLAACIERAVAAFRPVYDASPAAAAGGMR